MRRGKQKNALHIVVVTREVPAARTRRMGTPRARARGRRRTRGHVHEDARRDLLLVHDLEEGLGELAFVVAEVVAARERRVVPDDHLPRGVT